MFILATKQADQLGKELGPLRQGKPSQLREDIPAKELGPTITRKAIPATGRYPCQISLCILNVTSIHFTIVTTVLPILTTTKQVDQPSKELGPPTQGKPSQPPVDIPARFRLYPSSNLHYFYFTISYDSVCYQF